MAAPTYTHKPAPANPGPEDNLGGQVVDANRVAIQGIGSGFITTDISASPLTSPQTLSGTVTKLVVPVSAIQFTILNTGATNSLLISEINSTSVGFQLNSGQEVTMDIARQGAIWLSSASGTTCSFCFVLVD